MYNQCLLKYLSPQDTTGSGGDSQQPSSTHTNNTTIQQPSQIQDEQQITTPDQSTTRISFVRRHRSNQAQPTRKTSIFSYETAQTPKPAPQSRFGRLQQTLEHEDDMRQNVEEILTEQPTQEILSKLCDMTSKNHKSFSKHNKVKLATTKRLWRSFLNFFNTGNWSIGKT